MPSVLKTKYYGPITVEKVFQDGLFQVAKLPDGKGYCHTSGVPVQTEDELHSAIPPGVELEKALEWFKNKDVPKPETRKKLTVDEFGDWEFVDGTPVTSVSDLLNNLPAGPTLDAAYEWWKRKQSVKGSISPDVAKKIASTVKAMPTIETKEPSVTEERDTK